MNFDLVNDDKKKEIEEDSNIEKFFYDTFGFSSPYPLTDNEENREKIRMGRQPKG